MRRVLLGLSMIVGMLLLVVAAAAREIDGPSVPQSPAVAVRYVDASATGISDGSSWANAYKNLSLAWALAPYGTQIWIAEGTYTPGMQRADSFFLKDGVSLFGGFPAGGGDGTFEARFPAAHPTILSGDIGVPDDSSDNSYHVIEGDSQAYTAVVLDGVHITGGNVTGLADNNAGAGLFIQTSRVTLRNCMIYGNRSNGGAPALAAMDAAEVTIEDCTIAGNINTGQGSAIDSRDSKLMIRNSIIRDNQSGLGVGPLWQVGGESLLQNVVIVNNTNDAPSQGVITVMGGESSLGHVSVAGHNQPAVSASALNVNLHSSVLSANSIFWGNGASEFAVATGSAIGVSSSVVKGGYPGNNILNQDPLFTNLGEDDLTLQIASPAKNSGSLFACETFDLRGYPRPQSDGCDMGAYEAADQAIACATPNAAIPDDDPAGLNSTVTFPSGGIILDVDVKLKASHTYVGDLDAAVTLEDTGATQMLLDEPGYPAAEFGCDGQDIDVVLDDSAFAPVEDLCVHIAPAIRDSAVPTEPLSRYNGTPIAPNSEWTLNIADLVNQETGSLESWCVTVTTMPSLIVTRTDDPAPNGCLPNDCSLREAVIASNASTNINDVITFAVDGPFVLSQAGALEDAAATGDLDITDSVTIAGNGKDSTIIDGGAIDRVFQIMGGAKVTFTDLTIQNGLVDPVDDFESGGGLYASDFGTRVHLLRTIVRNNHAHASGSGTGSAGAASSVLDSWLIIEDSAVYGNSADEQAALLNFNAEVDIINSTVYGNAGDSQAILNLNDSRLLVRSSTIAANSSQAAIMSRASNSGESAKVTLQNSIISGPENACAIEASSGATATFTSLGNNIATDNTCNLDDPTDYPNTDPKLGPLADNGGNTMTAALLKGSPALDNGNDQGCPERDQRGLSRVNRDGNGDGGFDQNGCDIGAFELQNRITNTPPVADSQTVNVAKNTAKAITLTGSDAEGDSLSFQVITQPDHGTLSGTEPDLTYTPDNDYTGPDSFTFQALDGQMDSPAATVTLNVTAAPPVNTPPVANSQNVTTDMDTPVGIVLTASDADGDPLTYSTVLVPTYGTLTGVAPNLTYTPFPGHVGSDYFNFQVFDGEAYSQPGTISIQINEVIKAVTLFLPVAIR